MRRLAAIAAVATLLAGCGSDEPRDASADPQLPETTATTSAPATSTGPPTSARGNRVKALGEEGGFCHLDDPDCSEPLIVSFTVDAITVDIPCDSGFASPPANGHFIGINLRAATATDYDPNLFVHFTPDVFHVIGPDGVTVSNVATVEAYSCLNPARVFPQDPLGPGQQYVGTIVIDSPATSGVLTYIPPGQATGWEWPF